MKPARTIACAALIFFGIAIIAANLIFGIPNVALGIYSLTKGDIEAFKGYVSMIMIVGVMGFVMAFVPLIFLSIVASMTHFFIRRRAILAHIVVATASGLAMPIFFWLDDNGMIDWKLFSIIIPFLSGLISSLFVRSFINRTREQVGAAKPYHVASL